MFKHVTNYDKVRMFHEVMESYSNDKPKIPTTDVSGFRLALIEEEMAEVKEALEEGTDIEHIAKELADLLYVTYGCAIAYGINLDLAFTLVHDSNMTKLVDGKPIKNKAGKIIKPDTYKDPDMSGILDAVV